MLICPFLFLDAAGETQPNSNKNANHPMIVRVYILFKIFLPFIFAVAQATCSGANF